MEKTTTNARLQYVASLLKKVDYATNTIFSSFQSIESSEHSVRPRGLVLNLKLPSMPHQPAGYPKN